MWFDVVVVEVRATTGIPLVDIHQYPPLPHSEVVNVVSEGTNLPVIIMVALVHAAGSAVQVRRLDPQQCPIKRDGSRRRRSGGVTPLRGHTKSTTTSHTLP